MIFGISGVAFFKLNLELDERGILWKKSSQGKMTNQVNRIEAILIF